MINNQFHDIDPILDKWLPKFGLNVIKEYKNNTVRLVKIIDDGGLAYHIWIEESRPKNNLMVKAHQTLGKKINLRHVTKSWEEQSAIEDLPKTLDRAYTQVCAWVASNGNTLNLES